MKNDKLYIQQDKLENRRLLGAEIVDAAVLAGWEPSEDAKRVWDQMVCEAENFLTLLCE